MKLASTHSSSKLIAIFQALIEFYKITDNHIAMRVENRQGDELLERIRVVIREQDLFSENESSVRGRSRRGSNHHKTYIPQTDHVGEIELPLESDSDRKSDCQYHNH